MKPAAAAARLRTRGALQAPDFERLLSIRPLVRSEHFVLHHLPRAESTVSGELSTPSPMPTTRHVDDSPARFGLLVPKRHARRAVTRALIKRQGRTLFGEHGGALAAGDWLLRLRSPYPVTLFPSAASAALRGVVRQELQQLFSRATVACR